MQSSVTKKLSLREMIEQTDWASMNIAYGRHGVTSLKKDTITVGITTAGKGKPADRVIIRVSKEVLRDLEWRLGDKVIPMFSKNDQLLFRIVKADRGYIIAKDNITGAGKISFQFKGNVSLKKMPTTVQQHEVYKNQLIFRLGEWADLVV